MKLYINQSQKCIEEYTDNLKNFEVNGAAAMGKFVDSLQLMLSNVSVKASIELPHSDFFVFGNIKDKSEVCQFICSGVIASGKAIEVNKIRDEVALLWKKYVKSCIGDNNSE